MEDLLYDRDNIYYEVMNARQGFSSPLLNMGDFNEVIHIEERRGQAKESLSMRRFRG